MYCISASHKRISEDERQLFAFSQAEQEEFLRMLVKKGFITGGVIVSTCNRSELYVNAIESEESLENIEKEYCEYKKIKPSFMKASCLFYAGDGAIKQLFKVAAGLESALLGEDEILRQTKESYLYAAKLSLTDPEINMIFQSAFNCAKLIKTDTDLSKTAVSYGTLSANETQEYLKQHEGEFENPFVLVLGASGKMGSIVVKDLLDKEIRVIGTSRKHCGSEDSKITIVRDEGCEMGAFSDRYKLAQDAAVIISCTASPHYVLQQEKFAPCMANEKPKLLIDLAIPYDIDRAIGEMEGVTLEGIDYFKDKANENMSHRLKEKERALLMVEECMEDLKKKLYLRPYLDRIPHVADIRFTAKKLFTLKDVLDAESFKKVLEVFFHG